MHGHTVQIATASNVPRGPSRSISPPPATALCEGDRVMPTLRGPRTTAQATGSASQLSSVRCRQISPFVVPLETLHCAKGLELGPARPGEPIWKWKMKRGYNRRQLAYSEGRDMSDAGTRAGAMQGASPAAQRLESWKEIASYLKRDKRTVQRWEKEYGLPVHRLQLNTGSTVYAYPAELDAWYIERQPPNFPLDTTADDSDDADDPTSVEVSAGSTGANVSVEIQVNSAALTAGAESQTEGAGKESQFARRRVIQLQVSVTLASVAIVAFLAYSLNSSLFRPKPPSGKIRLVVLPFTNLSGDSQQDYFSAGLTDEMITQLGRLDPQHLGVIAAGSSKVLAGKPIPELGRTLDVQYALEGSVRRGGNQVRIDVQLIQVSDQTHLWADSYTGDLGNILRVQDEVAVAVARQIRVALPVSSVGANSSARAASRTVNPEAYDAYLRGRFYWTNRGDFRKSIAAYQQAISLQSDYAAAYVGLADDYVLLGQTPNDGLPPLEAKPQARAAAERALALDPNLGEAHAVLALIAFG